MIMLVGWLGQLLPDPLRKPVRPVDKTVDKDVDNKQDCRNSQHQMGTISAGFARSMETSRAVAAVNFVPVPYGRPANNQYT